MWSSQTLLDSANTVADSAILLFLEIFRAIQCFWFCLWNPNQWRKSKKSSKVADSSTILILDYCGIRLQFTERTVWPRNDKTNFGAILHEKVFVEKSSMDNATYHASLRQYFFDQISIGLLLSSVYDGWKIRLHMSILLLLDTDICKDVLARRRDKKHKKQYLVYSTKKWCFGKSSAILFFTNYSLSTKTMPESEELNQLSNNKNLSNLETSERIQYTSPMLYLGFIYNFLTNSTRVDLHRPKMLIIQFHKLSLWKNTNHTIFIHFAKMVSSNFRRTFLLFSHKFWCIVLNNKEKFFVKKY